MESLLIEVYIAAGKATEIKDGLVFISLDRLIGKITNDTSFNLSRNSPRTMEKVKRAGDAAAHDRVYITDQRDIDDTLASYRQMIWELLHLAKIKT
jgi:hypothetical protein